MRVYMLNGNTFTANNLTALNTSFGEAVKPSTFRIVDYSEVNHNRNNGEIDFLRGSSIDEATITVMFKESDKVRAHAVYEALANLPHEQYLWWPNNTNDGAAIQGYRKEVQLSILERGGITLRIRVLGIQSASQGASLTNVRRAPYIVARGNAGQITVSFTAADETDYELQTSLFAGGPWQQLEGTSAVTAPYQHDDLNTGDTHYYRARIYEATNNQNPWSEVIAAKVG